MRWLIRSTGKGVPSRRMDNHEMSRFVDTSDEWIRSHTGIGFRHIAEEGQAASDLGILAAREALEAAGLKPADIDLILVATATPDYNGFPSTACLIQEALGVPQAGAMDVAAGCTGFIYALDAAAGMIGRLGRRRALVIGTEVFSRIIDWKDRNTCVLFGDGAGAVILESLEDHSPADHLSRGLVHTILGSDGSGAEALMIREGGSRHPFRDGQTLAQAPHVEMDGRRVYNFAVKANTDLIQNLLAAEGLSPEDIRWIVPHQANFRILKAAAKRINLDEKKIFMNIEEYANTSAASIPIALDDLVRQGGLRRGDWVLFLGFGAGLTYGGSLLQW